MSHSDFDEGELIKNVEALNAIISDIPDDEKENEVKLMALKYDGKMVRGINYLEERDQRPDTDPEEDTPKAVRSEHPQDRPKRFRSEHPQQMTFWRLPTEVSLGASSANDLSETLPRTLPRRFRRSILKTWPS